MTSLVEANQVPCEKFESASLIILDDLKTCFMYGSTVIDKPNFEISSEKDETVQGLRLNSNKKIHYLPLDAYKKFPNLLGYDGHDCSVKFIMKANFHDLNNLRVIYMSRNKISTIFSDTFEGLSSLELINLGEVIIKSHIFLLIWFFMRRPQSNHANGWRAFRGTEQLKIG